MTSIELQTDPARIGRCHGVTGIYIRAKDGAGNWISADIAELNRDSLLAWLVDEPTRAVQVVLTSLEHEQLRNAMPVYRVVSK